MSWRGYRLVSTLTQWLSSVYKNQWLDTWDGTLPETVVILRDQAGGHLIHQMNYIVTQSNVPGWILNYSAGDVDWMSGSANDSLSSDNRLGLEGRWDFSWSGVDGHWTGQTLTVTPTSLSTSKLQFPNFYRAYIANFDNHINEALRTLLSCLGFTCWVALIAPVHSPQNSCLSHP